MHAERGEAVGVSHPPTVAEALDLRFGRLITRLIALGGGVALLPSGSSDRRPPADHLELPSVAVVDGPRRIEYLAWSLFNPAMATGSGPEKGRLGRGFLRAGPLCGFGQRNRVGSVEQNAGGMLCSYWKTLRGLYFALILRSRSKLRPQ